jgi:signal transduction histidine kinase
MMTFEPQPWRAVHENAPVHLEFRRLPNEQLATPHVGSCGSPAPGSSLVILLIDDSLLFREEFKRLLERVGYSVATAETAEEGLNTAAALFPDAIVVNRSLPGAGGLAVLHRLKQDVTLRDTPCLLLTASDAASDEEYLLEQGADGYLPRASDGNLMLARLAALLRHGGKAPNTAAGRPLSAKKILAVDQNVSFLTLLSGAWGEDGWDVVPARCGKEALEALERYTFDCILLNACLPDRRGVEICRIVKSRSAWRHIPILLWTDPGAAADQIEGLHAGADDCVLKSSPFALLKAHVRAQMRRKQFEEAAVQARAAQEAAQAQGAMVNELEAQNRELEAFAYSVSHDLRSPLRTIRGFTQALLADFDGQLPSGARDHLFHVMDGAARMSKLIDTLLELSRISRANPRREWLDLSGMARSVAAELAASNHPRSVVCSIEEGLRVRGDEALIRVLFDNLLGNAWKFTAKTAAARIEVGSIEGGDSLVYFVRDNGAGFDSSCSARLFQPFERLHPATEFPGSGIGLATVRRIVERHHGEIWAKSATGSGATFFFTLPAVN